MRENPFQPPNTVDAEPAVNSTSRPSARLAFRAMTLILETPALYNYLEYDAHMLMGSRLPALTVFAFRTFNLGAIVGGTLLIWFLGWPLLERASLWLHRLFAHQTDRQLWQEQLYRAVYRAAILSIPGAAIWLIWVFGFYRWKMNFYLISWLAGVPAHLLGAAVYVPLLFGWYRLMRGGAS